MKYCKDMNASDSDITEASTEKAIGVWGRYRSNCCIAGIYLVYFKVTVGNYYYNITLYLFASFLVWYISDSIIRMFDGLRYVITGCIVPDYSVA